MAKAKTEVVKMDPKTGEILDSDLMAGMLADADQREQFEADDMIIPRINILQDLSEQVKDRKPAYVEGAKPGMIFNGVNNALEPSILFVPSKFHTSWVAWKPRPEGGLVNNNVDPSILTEENGFFSDGIDQFVGHMAPASDPSGDKVKVEVIKTPEWIGIASGRDWAMPVAISFPKTFSKSARKMNTAIDLTEVEAKPGVFVTPPAFYHTFELKTGLEQAGENEWFGWSVQHLGWEKTEPRMRDKAKALRASFESGEATVAEQQEQ